MSACNIHGQAFTHGCPGCESADDAAIWEAIRRRVRNADWLPYRSAIFDIEATRTTGQLVTGPMLWRTPRFGPTRLWRHVCNLLNLTVRR